MSVLILSALCVFVLLAQGARASELAAGSAVGCPSAPSGWTTAPTDPQVWGPAQNPGQDTEVVTCTYSDGTKIASVVANFALPIDPNPFSDFDYGCNTKSTAWNPVSRTYVVPSQKVWAYAELNDSHDQLAASDVPGFEAATRALLQNSLGAAHSCKLTTVQTSVSSSFIFSFEYAETAGNFTAFGGVSSSIPGNAMIPAGSFRTATKSTGSAVLEKVVSVHVPLIPLTLVKGSKQSTVVMQITNGVNFYTDADNQRLLADVRVVRSNYPTCRRGSRGTITLTTHQVLDVQFGKPSIQLHLCGSLFSHGHQIAKVQINSG